jgi:hypothetical protein
VYGANSPVDAPTTGRRKRDRTRPELRARRGRYSRRRVCQSATHDPRAQWSRDPPIETLAADPKVTAKVRRAEPRELLGDRTFEKAQEILHRRNQDASLRRGNPTDFLRSGLVRCHHCGRAYVGTSAHGRNGRYTYYACSTRYKYGPAKCNGDRLPKDRLEAAMLTQLAEMYRDGHLIEQALTDLANVTESERPELEEQLGSTRAEIARVESKLERYFEAFEDGRLAADLFQERVRGHRDRLEALREREADLNARLATQAHTPPDGAALVGLADQLEDIVANESPEQAKELLRLLIKEVRVHGRRRIIPTYRIPAAVRAIPPKVGGTGLEPVTPSLSKCCRCKDDLDLSPTFSAQEAFRKALRRCRSRGLDHRLCVFCASQSQPDPNEYVA